MEPKLCQWAERQFVENQALVGGKIYQLSQEDPYWHQVNLYYLQMQGIIESLVYIYPSHLYKMIFPVKNLSVFK